MSNLKHILRLSITLLLITAAIAGALAGVNAITEDRIAAIEAEKTQKAIEAVLPGGGALLESFPDESGIVQAVYASDKGYAIQVAPVGFSGQIVMMVGVIDGKVYDISVINHGETPSLGAEAAANNEKGRSFREQFAGLDGMLAVTKDGGAMDAITGATITSRAICDGVNAALACAATLG